MTATAGVRPLTVVRPRRGRPPRVENFGWERFMRLPPNTAVVVRTTVRPRGTVVGRLVRVDAVRAVLVTLWPGAYAKVHEGGPFHTTVTRKAFQRARVVEGLWSHHLDPVDGLSKLEEYPDFPSHFDRPFHRVYLRGVPETRFRGVLVGQRGDRVEVLLDEATGETAWFHEREIEDEEMRRASGLVPARPGRRCVDPVADVVAEQVWLAKWTDWFDRWAE